MARRRSGIRTLLSFVVSAHAAYLVFTFIYVYLFRANLCLQPDLPCDEIAGIALPPIVVTIAAFSVSSVAQAVVVVSALVAAVYHFARFSEMHWLLRMVVVSLMATVMATCYGAIEGALVGDVISGAFIAFACGSVTSVIGSGFLQLCQRYWIVLIALALPAFSAVVLGLMS